MRWRRGRGLEELSRTAGPVARVVLREWLPPLGHGSCDGLLRSMSAARLLEGDNYVMHDPELIVAVLRALGWRHVRVSVHEEPADVVPLVLHPLGEPRYDRLRYEPGLGGPGVASSYVITGERDRSARLWPEGAGGLAGGCRPAVRPNGLDGTALSAAGPRPRGPGTMLSVLLEQLV